VPTVFRVAVRDSATNEAGQMATVTAPYAVKGVTKQAKVSFIGGDLFRVVIPAQVAGTVVTVTPTAVDRASLTTIAPPIVLTIGTPPVTGDGGAGGDTGVGPGAAGTGEPGEAGSGGELTTEGGSAGKAGSAGSSSGGKGGAATGGNDTAGAAGADNGEGGAGSSKPAASDDGCSCSMIPSTQGKSTALLGLGLAMLGLVRRRRNGK